MQLYIMISFVACSTTYTYLCPQGITLEEAKKFTHAVVDTVSSGLTVVKIQKVMELNESDYNGSFKPAVTLFSLDNYERVLADAKRKKAIEKELRERIAKRSLEKSFEELLKDDTEGLKLLEEFKKL